MIKKIFICTWFLVFSPNIFAQQVVRCQGKLYSLDYALIKDSLPFGPLISEKDLSSGEFVKTLMYGVIFLKVAPDLKEKFQEFFHDLKNENDFSRPHLWQSNDLPFPLKEFSVKDLPGISKECFGDENQKISVYTVVQATKKGKLTIYEYDRQLLSELSLSEQQLAFVSMSVFLNPFEKDFLSGVKMNALIHSQNTIFLPEVELHEMAQANLILSNHDVEICTRFPELVKELQKELGLPCEEMTPDDLLWIKNLVVHGKGTASSLMHDNDFLGLRQLESLSLLDMNRTILSVQTQNLADLKNLKHLRLSDHDINETPKNFMEGPFQLYTLDLSSNNIFELKRNAFRNVFSEHAPAGMQVTLNLSGNTANTTPRPRVYVHPGSFDHCQAVTHLLMHDFNLDALNSEVFEPLIHLEFLDLSANVFRRFEGVLRSAALGNLRTLDLSNNAFKNIKSEEFEFLLSLEELKLQNNQLTEFPAFLLHLPSLKHLSFCGKNFKSEDLKKIGDLAKTTNPNLQITFCEH